jgi:hypothetical protein
MSYQPLVQAAAGCVDVLLSSPQNGCSVAIGAPVGGETN